MVGTSGATSSTNPYYNQTMGTIHSDSEMKFDDTVDPDDNHNN